MEGSAPAAAPTIGGVAYIEPRRLLAYPSQERFFSENDEARLCGGLRGERGMGRGSFYLPAGIGESVRTTSQLT
jgi:hypothetical protein